MDNNTLQIYTEVFDSLCDIADEEWHSSKKTKTNNIFPVEKMLNEMLEAFIQIEEYEKCIKVKRWKEIFEKSQQ